MIILLSLKLLVTLVFLIMFLRRPSPVWGVGLLTVTSAVLLDTLFGAFGSEQTRADLGFFFPVISGALFAGAAIWLWGLLRPLTAVSRGPLPAAEVRSSNSPLSRRQQKQEKTAFDRQMIYDQIRQRFGYDDVLDLIFDLEINENDVMSLTQSMDQLIVSIMDHAERQGQMATLALAVERILTPARAEHLPRLEKMDVDSPRTVWRQYLLAHYDVNRLRQLATAVGADWEQLAVDNKKALVRNLLLYLHRRNCLPDLVERVHQEEMRTASNI